VAVVGVGVGVCAGEGGCGNGQALVFPNKSDWELELSLRELVDFQAQHRHP
jgi:hypothetical protein